MNKPVELDHGKGQQVKSDQSFGQATRAALEQRATMINQQKLYDASEHVQYEWESFYDCVDLIRVLAAKPKEERTKQEHVTYNAILTSLVIHARNLIHFFYGTRHKDDIIAEDYCPKWSSLRPLKSAFLQNVEERVHKLAAHLTYTRIAINRNWEWTDVRNELSPIWEQWKQCAPPHLLQPRNRP